jgi:hypothetical protein
MRRRHRRQARSWCWTSSRPRPTWPGGLACPRCAGRLRPWSWAPVRRVRQLDGSVGGGGPAAAHRCAQCRSTYILLPAWCLPRRADTVEVVGAALTAHAAGRGHRSTAADLGRPVSTAKRPSPILARAVCADRWGGQGRGRTGDLPLFRSPDDRSERSTAGLTRAAMGKLKQESDLGPA